MYHSFDAAVCVVPEAVVNVLSLKVLAEVGRASSDDCGFGGLSFQLQLQLLLPYFSSPFRTVQKLSTVRPSCDLLYLAGKVAAESPDVVFQSVTRTSGPVHLSFY